MFFSVFNVYLPPVIMNKDVYNDGRYIIFILIYVVFFLIIVLLLSF